MHKQTTYQFMLSPRCGARTRRGATCLSPAVRGKRRCRMHGGAKGSGAPRGSQNALKHGYNTHEFKAQRQQIKIHLKKDFWVANETNIILKNQDKI